MRDWSESKPLFYQGMKWREKAGKRGKSATIEGAQKKEHDRSPGAEILRATRRKKEGGKTL